MVGWGVGGWGVRWSEWYWPHGAIGLTLMMWQKSKVIIQVPAAIKMLMGNTRV